MAFAGSCYTDCGTVLAALSEASGGIYLYFYNASTGAEFDLAGMSAGQYVEVNIFYITDSFN